jgi:hypothetical protein
MVYDVEIKKGVLSCLFLTKNHQCHHVDTADIDTIICCYYCNHLNSCLKKFKSGCNKLICKYNSELLGCRYLYEYMKAHKINARKELFIFR